MVLLDDVVEVFVDRDLLGLTMLLNCPFQKAASREEGVHRGAISIDGSIKILPAAADLYVSLVHTPAFAHRALPAAEYLGQRR